MMEELWLDCWQGNEISLFFKMSVNFFWGPTEGSFPGAKAIGV